VPAAPPPEEGKERLAFRQACSNQDGYQSTEYYTKQAAIRQRAVGHSGRACILPWSRSHWTSLPWCQMLEPAGHLETGRSVLLTDQDWSSVALFADNSSP